MTNPTRAQAAAASSKIHAGRIGSSGRQRRQLPVIGLPTRGCPIRYPSSFVAALLLAAGLHAQQASPELYRIDLVFNGIAFALDEPKLQGDAYVLHGWPDGAIIHIKRVNVRKITPWTRKPTQDIAYRIDVLPSGHMFSRDEPTLTKSMYVFRTSRDGRVVSLRQADVRKITRLTSAEALQEEHAARGAVVIGDLAMQGGSSQAGPSNANAVGRPGAGAGNGSAQGSGNWVYQGTPGATDAYAPASATVSAPGDVPRMSGGPTAH
jgi:hypothetical protein